MIQADIKKQKSEIQISGIECDVIVEMFLIIKEILENISNEKAKKQILNDLKGIAECGDAGIYFTKIKKRSKDMKVICIDAEDSEEALKEVNKMDIPEEAKEILKKAIKEM